MFSPYSADPIFEANNKQIDNLLHRIHDGTLAIPDFQRDFTWEPKRTQELIKSIMSRYPAGTLLFWAMGGDESAFGWREVEGAPKSKQAPQELILDGQQRLTCLYRALNAVGPERFYVRLDHFWTEEKSAPNTPENIDFDEAIFWHDAGSKESNLLEKDEHLQLSRHVFPLHRNSDFDEWLDRYVKVHPGVDEDATKKLLRKIRDRYLTPLKSYGFPVVSLPATTPIDAVCTVFETLNKTGKQLGVFELLTARFYPKGIKLRDLWNDALETHDTLTTFNVDPYSVMQAVALRAQRSAQRSTVLNKVQAADVKEHWDICVRGFARVLDLLSSDCGIISPRWLPYSMLLVPMAAAWETIQQVKGPEKNSAIDRLKQYFWSTVFTSNFDQGANSQAGADYIKLVDWLLDKEKPAPEAVHELVINESTLATATTRRKAIYAGIVALTVQNGARDFYSGHKLTKDRLSADKIDSHHVFPKKYLSTLTDGQKSGLSSELALNRTLIDPSTNKIIAKNKPSDYVQRLKDSIDESNLSEIFESHLIDFNDSDDPLLKDDYAGFIGARLKRVVEQIKIVTGKNVTRDVSG